LITLSFRFKIVKKSDINPEFAVAIYCKTCVKGNFNYYNKTSGNGRKVFVIISK